MGNAAGTARASPTCQPKGEKAVLMLLNGTVVRLPNVGASTGAANTVRLLGRPRVPRLAGAGTGVVAVVVAGRLPRARAVNC